MRRLLTAIALATMIVGMAAPSIGENSGSTIVKKPPGTVEVSARDWRVTG